MTTDFVLEYKLKGKLIFKKLCVTIKMYHTGL